ncbi:MAG: hypothetical protein KKB50_11435 [Planctomycetes bacterium]|nr:hypothetical protein [Planctomycetota bacterium]
MKRLVLIAAVILVAAPAVADTFLETFPDPLGGWNNRFLYQNSDMENYYIASSSSNDPNYRGNNPEGLWIAEPQGYGSGVGGPIIDIDFDPAFGSLITYIEFGLECWTQCDITVYDMGGTALATKMFMGGGFDFDHADIMSASSTNGVSKFVFDSTPYTGGQIEGNTSIDNVQIDIIPEPSTVACLGLLSLVLVRRR